ncbi:MAG: hypothetical protein DMG70_24590 [Acidobacteria bacterium]|nr:MAG: hypothetical protein DMG70_24590 [Acidobacteriota bacterium]PYY09800.1 MAG: hypothetical protein DMG69_09595 [Acidobacteriota bacterium]
MGGVGIGPTGPGGNGTTAQGGGSFRVQCPTTTPLHPTAISNSAPGTPLTEAAEPAYTGPAVTPETVGGQSLSYTLNGGTVKCQEISGGDGYSTMADGNQIFMFSFGPLSGMDLIKNGQAGTLFAADFNNYYNEPNQPAVAAAPNDTPDPTYDPKRANSLNGGIADPGTIMEIGVLNGNIPAPLMAFDEDDEFFLTLSNVGMIMRPDLFEEHTVHFHGYPNASSYYDGVPDATWAINIGGSATYYYVAPDAGTYFWHCHITPPEHLQMGMVGQLYVRPRQNREPAGTNLYNAVAGSATSGTFGSLPGPGMQSDLRTACPGTGTTPAAGYTYGASGSIDILCSAPIPLADTGAVQVAGAKYAYDDGDGSTRYDIDVPIQIHGFDPNFHFVGMTFNPEGFADMKDKYFLLNGRSYPDTISAPSTNPGYAGLTPNAPAQDPTSNAIGTEDSDGLTRYSQPLPTLITLHSSPANGPSRALLRIADLDVTEYQTLASLGIPMTVVGFNAKLLRDQAGNNLFIKTNSITLGGGESLDAILDATGVPPGTYFLYTPNLDHLSNDAENFGGLMTEVVVVN